MLQLINKDSQTNCHLITHFPYYFGRFTQARYWVETKPKYGQKLCYQFFDPQNQNWSKPKSELFTDICIMQIQEDINAHDYGLVKSAILDFRTASEAEVKSFSEEWYLDSYQRDIMLNQLRTYRSDYRTKFKGPPSEVILPNANMVQLQPFKTSQPIQNVEFAPVVTGPGYDTAPFDAARLVLETWVAMPYAEAIKDRAAWERHHKIKTDAEDLLKTEPGYSPPEFSPVSISDLTRGGK